MVRGGDTLLEASKRCEADWKWVVNRPAVALAAWVPPWAASTPQVALAAWVPPWAASTPQVGLARRILISSNQDAAHLD